MTNTLPSAVSSEAGPLSGHDPPVSGLSQALSMWTEGGLGEPEARGAGVVQGTRTKTDVRGQGTG